MRLAVIVKEKGKFCVRSPSNKSWSGGCFDSKGEAEDRLKAVEYFKHQKSSSMAARVMQRFLAR